MAQKTIVTVLDDLDDTEGAETHAFSFGDTAYEIDLNERNSAKFTKAMQPFMDAARRTGRASVGAGSGRGRSSGGGARGGREPGYAEQLGYNNSDVRAWAIAAGKQVGAKGRIPTEIVDEYDAAQKGGASSNGNGKAPAKKAPAKKTAAAKS